jgi:hypothetical protein
VEKLRHGKSNTRNPAPYIISSCTVDIQTVALNQEITSFWGGPQCWKIFFLLQVSNKFLHLVQWIERKRGGVGFNTQEITLLL